jgi:tripartite ATP-independent transporter DctP family solute receptor
MRKSIRTLRVTALAAAMALLAAGGAEAQAKRVKLGTMAPDGSPWMESLTAMSKLLEQNTGGAFRWQIFPGGQLGDEIQMSEGAQFGSIECAGVSTGALANLLPSMNVFEIPFFWESREQAYYVIDNQFRDFFAKEMDKVGLVLLGWSENGWRHFFTKTDKVVRNPDDFKGLRMRSQESPVHIAFWKTLGVNPMPLATTEIYQALERGIIDGGDNTLVLIAATGWIEVLKTITLTSHIYQPAVLACNKGWWAKVPDNHKQAFFKAMRDTEQDMRVRLAKSDDELRVTFKEMGKQVVEPSDAELAAFRQRAGAVIKDPAIRKLIGEEALRIAEEGKAAYKAGKP